MTYRTLLHILNTIPAERLDDTVTVHDPYSDEFTAIVDVKTADEKTNDVLDNGHVYLEMKA